MMEINDQASDDNVDQDTDVDHQGVGFECQDDNVDQDHDTAKGESNDACVIPQ